MLVSFNLRAQQYGEFLNGYRWSIYGCLTFKGSPSQRTVNGALTKYIRALKKSIGGAVAFVAVCEKRDSGCGKPGTSLHWHFVAACRDSRSTDLLCAAKVLWSENGNAKIEAYDEHLPGVHYLTKTAIRDDFEFRMGGLDWLTYRGPSDIHAAVAANEYVPTHANWLPHAETLAVRPTGGAR